MSIFLKGLGLRNYRSIGPEMQKMGPFKKFNFFIGANNSGKSTILNFISNHLPVPQAQFNTTRVIRRVDNLEVYSGGMKGNVSMCLGVPIEEFSDNALRAAARHRGYSDNLTHEAVNKIAQFMSEGSLIWFTCDLPYVNNLTYQKVYTYDQNNSILPAQLWEHLWTHMTSQRGGSLSSHWIPETLTHILNAQNFSLPRIRMIPAIRQIGPSGEEFSDFSGRGVIDRLAEIQSPDHDKLTDKVQFEKINRFLQVVTTEKSARIEIPHNRPHILVHMNDKVLPISSLGMGIHEVIMIATFCTLSDNQIICIEEPEIHLHPILQRKLVEYLQNETSNQYFVTTHSASFIDTEGAAIFHVTNDGTQARVSETILRKERFSICTDLGHRASEIIQSNAVIWVEGPSDRLYIRHWLKQTNPNLLEGIHYSIMFYGGRLLSHLSAQDDEVNEFINLRALNQNLVLVMDSDKSSTKANINGTKQRLISELSMGHGVVWLTLGREIENYIEFEILQNAVKQIYGPTYDKPASNGRFEHALHFYRKERNKNSKGNYIGGFLEKNVDKVKVARLVCEQTICVDVLDLKERLEQIAQLIENANL